MAEWPGFDGTQACEGADIETFYVEIGASVAEAKDICLSGCPFLLRCREWGIAHEDYGVWGGMSPQMRRSYRNEHGIHLRAPQIDVERSNGARKAWARRQAAAAAREGASQPGKVRADDIIALTAAHFGLTRDDLCGMRGWAGLVHARHIAMYLCRTLLGMSLPEVGRAFGGRDHTTALYAERKVKDAIAGSDLAVVAPIAQLTAKLGIEARRRAAS